MTNTVPRPPKEYDHSLPWDSESWQQSGHHQQVCRLQLALLRADDALRAIQLTADVDDVHTQGLALTARRELRECIEGEVRVG